MTSTPLLDWMEAQPPQPDLGRDWIRPTPTSQPLPDTPHHPHVIAASPFNSPDRVICPDGRIGTVHWVVEEASIPDFHPGDIVNCRSTPSGRQPWSGWEGVVECVECDRAFIRFGDFPLYSISTDLIEGVETPSSIKIWVQVDKEYQYFGFRPDELRKAA